MNKNIDWNKESVFIDNFYERDMSFRIEDLEEWVSIMKEKGFKKARLKVDFGWEGEVEGVIIEAVSNGD